MLESIVDKLRQARSSRVAIAPFTNETPELGLKEAYEIQNRGLELSLAEGHWVAGYKMGLTSRAKQADVQVFETIRGYLLGSTEVAKGSTVQTNRWIHPRVEPEVAVVLNKAVGGPRVNLRDVIEALAFIGPALEIIDSRYERYAFKLPDVVADNASAAGFMVGTQNWLARRHEVSLFGVAVKKNGEILETGAPAAVLGDPLLSVLGLAQTLAREDKVIEPGQVILTGGVTTSVPFCAGDVLEIVWPGETLSFRAL